MRTIQVRDWSTGPELVEVEKPEKHPQFRQVQVVAAGFHKLVYARLTNNHYSSGNLPHVAGVDGVGIDTETGKMVYFAKPSQPEGSFAEFVNTRFTFELPTDSNPDKVAALMNPVMSSWMAFHYRVDFLRPESDKPRPEWSCFILGASTMSGRIAAEVARYLGATHIIGAARNESILQKMVENGSLDEYVVLHEDHSTQFSPKSLSCDVVLDYIYGEYAESYFQAYVKNKAAVRMATTYINIGSLAGGEARIPAAILRSKDFTMRGSGIGSSWSVENVAKEVPAMLEMLCRLHIPDDEITRVGFEDLSKVVANEVKGRIVFAPS